MLFTFDGMVEMHAKKHTNTQVVLFYIELCRSVCYVVGGSCSRRRSRSRTRSSSKLHTHTHTEAIRKSDDDQLEVTEPIFCVLCRCTQVPLELVRTFCRMTSGIQ